MQALTLPRHRRDMVSFRPDARQIKKEMIEEVSPCIGKLNQFEPATAAGSVLLPTMKGSIIVCITFAVDEYLYSAMKA